MSSGIFTRKAGELIFHDKIQQSSIDFTRFGIGKRSNRSAKEIIIVGIGKSHNLVLSWAIVTNKQSNTRAKERQARKRQIEKRGWIKRHGWSGGEENERQMPNNVMREIRVCDGYLVCWLLRRPPWQRRQKSFLLPLEHCVGFPLKRKGDAVKQRKYFPRFLRTRVSIQ